MKVLITGSQGQLAKAFIKEFIKNNTDYLAPAERDLDITDKDKIRNIIKSYNPSVIINCAAYNNVEQAQADPKIAYLLNQTAVFYLVEQASRTGAEFIHFGTDYVFDGQKRDVYVETDLPNPLNEYGKSKLDGEQEALKYDRSLVLRLSWVIGEGRQNFLYKFSGWAKNNKIIKVSEDEISVPCFAFDIVAYTLKALKNGSRGLYHLTNSGYCSRYELALKYASLMNFDNQLIPVPMSSFNLPVQRALFTAMSNKKISDVLNVSIPHWQQSLELFCKSKING